MNIKGEEHVRQSPEDIERLLKELLGRTVAQNPQPPSEFIAKWRKESPHNEFLFQNLQRPEQLEEWMHAQRSVDVDAALSRVKAKRKVYQTSSPKKVLTRNWSMRWHTRLPYVAAMLIFLLVSVYWGFYRNGSNQAQHASGVTDIMPGGYGAKLIFADGRSMELDESQQGITLENGHIRYLDGSEVTNTTDQRQDELAGQYVLTTPLGRNYELTLSDGTKVWLNAGSSLRYPKRFETGQPRRISLEGEAYFQVQGKMSSNESVSFIIETNDQLVEVLGTEFNINAYADEPHTLTTLVEGSVQVTLKDSRSDENVGVNLRPGEQSKLPRQSKPTTQSELATQNNLSSQPKVSVVNSLQQTGFTVQEVNPALYTAWRSGVLVLTDADLPTVIRQIERWYDVSFDFEDPLPQVHWHGEIPRTVPLSEVLQALSKYTGMQFHLNAERRVTVRK